MKTFVLLLLLIVPTILFSQETLKKGEIRGRVTDSTGKENFSLATVVLLNHKDSSVVAVTTTDEQGRFQMAGLADGKYRVYITSVQFFPYTSDFEINDNQPSKNFATIKVRRGKTEEMATVVAEAPVIVKQDTVEYKADAFKTRPNAVVEDLLKKLPGVQVDKNGNITAHGQTVTKVLVDGKPFFGNDPKTATKNLPANIVDKVQVLDRKSDQSQFTGFDDGTTEKVINITIKKDKRKGVFGRIGGGVGTNDRYESNASLNRFNNGMQLSFIGQANNINNEGFTFQDMMDFSGGFGGLGRTMGGGNDGGGMGGGAMSITMTRTGSGGGMNFGGMNLGGPSTGIRTSQAAGVNYSNAWGKKLNVSGSYFYNNSYAFQESYLSRQNFPPDTAFRNITDQSTITRNRRTNHRLNLDFDWNIDSFNSLLFRPAITFVQSRSRTETGSLITGFDKNLRSQNNQAINNYNEQPNFSGTLLWRHKMRVKGRTLSVRINAGMNNTDGHGDNFNQQRWASPIVFSQLTDQVNFTDNSSNTFNTRIAYTEPLSKTRLLELYYSYGRNFSVSDRETYRRDGLGAYTILDSNFTNDFTNLFANHVAGFNVQTKKKKYDYTLGMSVQQANLNSNNIIKNSTIRQQNVYNIFPVARMRLNVGRNKNLNLSYRGNTNQPTASQLQPVVDNSNPLSIRQGNPALKQEFTNNLNLVYNKFDMVKLKTFFVFLNFSNTSNKISDSVANIAPGVQSRKPVNVNGNWNMMGSFSMGIPVRRFKTTNINISTSFFNNHTANITDGLKNFTRLLSVTQNLGINYNYKDKLDVMLSGMGSYNNTRYTLKNVPANEYYSWNGSVDVSYTFPKTSFTLQSDLDYNSYRGRSEGYNTEFILWNASISKLLLKDKSLELRLTAFDMLKQNRAINRSTQETFIEDSRSNVLTQYFMVSLK
ncbi:MAG: TonB-dependent receptor, partial [Dinghuibacter sp.]|nr:TonB-dependent receptor [Dinghuibacter sp.]